MPQIGIYLFLLLTPIIVGQPGFSLEDLNPNSFTYGQMIGPSNYEGDITILFLVMKHEALVETGLVFLTKYIQI